MGSTPIVLFGGRRSRSCAVRVFPSPLSITSVAGPKDQQDLAELLRTRSVLEWIDKWQLRSAVSVSGGGCTGRGRRPGGQLCRQQTLAAARHARAGRLGASAYTLGRAQTVVYP